MTFDIQDLMAQVAKLNEHFLNDSGVCVYCYNVGLKDEFCERNPYSVIGINLESVFKHIDSTENKLRMLSQELYELRGVFNLTRAAQMRAMKIWQDSTGQAYVWPDHTELVTWLLERIQKLENKIQDLSSSVEIYESGVASPDFTSANRYARLKETTEELENKFRKEISILTQERDEARSYGSAAYTLQVICEALDLGGVSALKLAEMLGRPWPELRTVGLQRVANALFDACHAEVYASELEDARDKILELTRCK